MQRVHFQVQVSIFNCQQILTKSSFVSVDIMVKKQIKCGLAWSVFLSTASTCHHRICCALTQLCFVNPQHCDDVYSLLIRVQTMLNHIRFVNATFLLSFCMPVIGPWPLQENSALELAHLCAHYVAHKHKPYSKPE